MSSVWIRYGDIGCIISQTLDGELHGLSIQEEEAELPSFHWFDHGVFHGPALRQVPDESGRNKGAFWWALDEYDHGSRIKYRDVMVEELEAVLLEILNYSSDPLTSTGASIIWGLVTRSRGYPTTFRWINTKGKEKEESGWQDQNGWRIVPQELEVQNPHLGTSETMVLYSFTDPWLERDRSKLVYFCLALDCPGPILEALSIAFKNPLTIPIIDDQATH